MRRLLLFVFVVFVVFVGLGCNGAVGRPDSQPEQQGGDKEKGERGKQDKEKQVKHGTPKKDRPRPLTVRYQGRDAREWSEILNDADEKQSFAAIDALKAIGSEVAPWVTDLARSSIIPHVKALAIEAFPTDGRDEWRDEWAGILNRELASKYLLVRNRAALTIERLGYKECAGAVQARLAAERDPIVLSILRRAANKTAN